MDHYEMMKLATLQRVVLLHTAVVVSALIPLTLPPG